MLKRKLLKAFASVFLLFPIPSFVAAAGLDYPAENQILDFGGSIHGQAKHVSNASLYFFRLRQGSTVITEFRSTSRNFALQPDAPEYGDLDPLQSLKIRVWALVNNSWSFEGSTDVKLRGGGPVQPIVLVPSDRTSQYRYTAISATFGNFLTDVQRWYRDTVGRTFDLNRTKYVFTRRTNAWLWCRDLSFAIREGCAHENYEENVGTVLREYGVPFGDISRQEFPLVLGFGAGGYASGSELRKSVIIGEAPIEAYIYGSCDSVTLAFPGDSVRSDCAAYGGIGWPAYGVGVPAGTIAHELGHAFGLPGHLTDGCVVSIMDGNECFPAASLRNDEISWMQEVFR